MSRDGLGTAHEAACILFAAQWLSQLWAAGEAEASAVPGAGLGGRGEAALGQGPAQLPAPAPPHCQELIRKGIPHHFRAIVWQLLCSATDMPVKNQYSELLKMSSPCEKLIRRDIARTYPEHEFFKGQDSLGQEVLFNVMKVRPGSFGPPLPRPLLAQRALAVMRVCSLAGIFPGGQGGGLLPGQRLHRGPAPHAGRWLGPAL